MPWHNLLYVHRKYPDNLSLIHIFPESAREILKQINTDLDTFVSIEEFGGYPNNNNIGEAKVLFERYNVDEKMEEILREQK